MDESPRNYYGGGQAQSEGFKYREEGKDVIKELCDMFRGGVSKDEKGKIVYNEEFRMMNDHGVHAISGLLRSITNKLTHLTRFENEERVHRQQKAEMLNLLIDFTLNMKLWAPKATMKYEDLKNGECRVTYSDNTSVVVEIDDLELLPVQKVRNRNIVLEMVESPIFHSKLRSIGGMEQEITGKTHMVNETIETTPKPQQTGGFASIWGGGNGKY
jgi:hypothetical protein